MANVAQSITTDEYRNGILNLMVNYLGIAWAKPNITVPYCGLNDIPDDMLPTPYAKAQNDAVAMGPDA